MTTTEPTIEAENAVHELGHACVGLCVGIRVDGIEIDDDGGKCWHYANTSGRSLVERVAFLESGRLAEFVVLGVSPNPATYARDRGEIEDLVQHIRPTWKRQPIYTQSLFLARGHLDRNVGGIERALPVLLKRRKLSGAEVRRLLFH